MSIYNLPLLSVKEIVNYLNELEIDISPNEILKPNINMVNKLYMDLIMLFTNINEINSNNIQFINTLSFLFKVIGLDFNLKRDLNPDSKRFQKIMSFFINFSMFRDSKREIYEKANQIADKNKFYRNQILEKKENLIKEIESHRLKSIESESKELKIKKLNEDLKNIIKLQKEKIIEVSQLKKEKIEFNDKFSSYEMMEHNIKQDIAILNSQIVSNPEKILELINEMRNLIEQEKNNINEINLKIKEKNTSLNEGRIKLNEISIKHKVIEEIKENEEVLDNLENKVNVIKSNIKNIESLIKNKKIRKTHIDRQIKHIESKISSLTEKDKKNSEEMQNKIKEVKDKYEIVSKDKSKSNELLKNNNKKIQSLIYERAKIENEQEKKIREIINLLMELKMKIEF